MAKRGRKTKLTPKLQEQIIKYIEAGNYIKVACKAVGISARTYELWNKEGLKIEAKCFDDDGEKIESEWQKITEFEKTKFRFFRSIQGAEARGEIRNVTIINLAAKEDWRASLEMLARKYHKRWGLKKQIGGTGEEPIKIEIKNKDLEKELMDELNKMAERYKKKKKGK